MNLLVLDNYDSFTYNLVQYLRELTDESIDVFRNDEITLAEVEQYDTIVLSPGPGIPSEAGIMPELIQRYAPSKSIFGVCLGQQAIGEAFGGDLHNLTQVFHGIATAVYPTEANDPIFGDLGKEFMAGRYHSWVIKKENFPDSLEITALDEEGMIMAIRHREYHVKGVQFHPESVMTECGPQILSNFLKEARQRIQQPAAGRI
ncbi:MAG: aminodeoxychorismate/anthranilate synthase component II [Bacteroidota bacterium]